jgi:hypothetical protein
MKSIRYSLANHYYKTAENHLFQCYISEITGLDYVTVSSSVDCTLHMLPQFSHKEHVYNILVPPTSSLPLPKSAIS